MSKRKNIDEMLLLANAIQSETDYCVFIDLSGHVNWLEISIRKSKKEYSEDVIKFGCPTGTPSGMYKGRKISTKRERDIIDRLKSLLKKRKFNIEKYRCNNKKCILYNDDSVFAYLNCSDADSLSDVMSCSLRA